MKRIAIFVFGVILCATSAFANKCDWATNTPNDDVKYKYFVAKTYSDTSASDAANKAERDIDSQLGRLFGVALNVQSDFYADETTSAGTTRSYERSIGILSLKGLERQKSDVDKESGGWVGCVQYRYSQQEFQKEKQRLAKSPASATANIVFTEVAGDTTCRGAPVEIITTPTNAFVTLDDGKYQGTSPIKFGNVCNGKHTLEITKENYANIQEKLIVQNKVKISKTLKRDTKLITVHTSLGNSKITINGIDYGTEPVKFNAPLGIEQTITATNPEAIKITKARTFSKYSNSEYTIDMDKLPGKIDFSAFKKRNPGVSISVDGKKITGNTTGELSPDYEHIVVLSKKDFFDIQKSVNIRGDETTFFPSSELDFSKTPKVTYSVLLGLGSTITNNTKLGANLDLGVDLKTKYLYAGAGVQLNYISIPNAKLQFKYNNRMYSVKHTADIDLTYIEFLYSHIGLNLNDNWSLLGIGSLGALRSDAEKNRSTASLIVGSASKTVFRYGLGIQYIISRKEADAGIRVSYLTGSTHLTPDDITFRHINNYDTSPLNLTDKAFGSFPDRISSVNVTFFVRFTKPYGTKGGK